MEENKHFLVVAAQPTLDHIAIVPDVSLGKAHRLESVTLLPSGKALNVARSLKSLGAPVRVAALLAGHNGRWIEEALKQLDISVQAAWMGGENRLAYSVYDPRQESLTEFIEDTDGPVTVDEWHELHRLVMEMLPGACALILAGRAPRGAPEDGYKHLVELAHTAGLPVFMDCYGPLLEHAIPASPVLLKVNQREAGSLSGAVPHTPAECAAVAQQLSASGIQQVIITLGGGGAIAVGPHGTWQALPPKLRGAAIGSGDAMLAGIALTLVQGWTLDEALRMGVAVGAANVLVPGAGVFRIEDVTRIRQQVRVIPI